MSCAHNLLRFSGPHGSDMLTPKAADKLQALSSPEVPGPGDVAVKEYGEWQAPNVRQRYLKTAFREGSDVMLERSRPRASIQGSRSQLFH
jgi:hypothetical protein